MPMSDKEMAAKAATDILAKKDNALLVQLTFAAKTYHNGDIHAFLTEWLSSLVPGIREKARVEQRDLLVAELKAEVMSEVSDEELDGAAEDAIDDLMDKLRKARYEEVMSRLRANPDLTMEDMEECKAELDLFMAKLKSTEGDLKASAWYYDMKKSAKLGMLKRRSDAVQSQPTADQEQQTQPPSTPAHPVQDPPSQPRDGST